MQFLTDCVHRAPTDVKVVVNQVLQKVDEIQEISKFEIMQNYTYNPNVV